MHRERRSSATAASAGRPVLGIDDRRRIVLRQRGDELAAHRKAACEAAITTASNPA